MKTHQSFIWKLKFMLLKNLNYGSLKVCVVCRWGMRQWNEQAGWWRCYFVSGCDGRPAGRVTPRTPPARSRAPPSSVTSPAQCNAPKRESHEIRASAPAIARLARSGGTSAIKSPNSVSLVSEYIFYIWIWLCRPIVVLYMPLELYIRFTYSIPCILIF